MDLHLDPQGPHSADYTQQVADGLEECVRVLAYATRTDDGVPDPAVAASVLGSLDRAVAGLDQVLRQLADRLGEKAATRLRSDDRDPAGTLAAVRSATEAARIRLIRVTTDLRQAHTAASRLYLAGEGEPERADYDPTGEDL